MSREIKFVDINKVRSVVVTYHKVRETTKKGWFSREVYLEEVKTFAGKYIFKDGKILKREELAFRDDGTYRTSYEYYNGLEINNQTIDPKGHIIEKNEFEYHANNELKQKVTHKYGESKGVIYNLYDSHGNIVEYSSIDRMFSTPFSYQHKYTWQYGTGMYGRLEVRIDKDNSKKEFHYDCENRLKKTINYDKYGTILSSVEYIYDLQGRDYKLILDGCYVEEERYNEHGDIIWYKWYPNYWYNTSAQDKYKESITTMKYVYDSHGNWVEFRQYRDGVYNLLWIREIEYY